MLLRLGDRHAREPLELAELALLRLLQLRVKLLLRRPRGRRAPALGARARSASARAPRRGTAGVPRRARVAPALVDLRVVLGPELDGFLACLDVSLAAHRLGLALGVLQELLPRPHRLVEARGAHRANDQNADARRRPRGRSLSQRRRARAHLRSCRHAGLGICGGEGGWRPAPRELLRVYVAKWGRSGGRYLSGFARSIRKASCAGKSSNSEVFILPLVSPPAQSQRRASHAGAAALGKRDARSDSGSSAGQRAPPSAVPRRSRSARMYASP